MRINARASGLMSHCTWLVEVPNGNPEPDSRADMFDVVECGAAVVLTHDGEGWRCDAGHEHLPLEIELAPFGVEWEREQMEAMCGADHA